MEKNMQQAPEDQIMFNKSQHSNYKNSEKESNTFITRGEYFRNYNSVFEEQIEQFLQKSNSQIKQKDDDQEQEDIIKKPKNDKNEYEIFTTKNGIKTLLIAAPEVYDYGASLTIKGVGSYQDGEQNPGLSHFVEHLVFTGSKNYPDWDLVSDISIQNGVFNGLTMSNTTQYPIGFPQEQILEETMKKIVDFIINPGLKEDVITREIFAITSEYHLDIVDSGAKIEYIWKMLCNPNNPLHTFDIGSVESLKNAIKNPQIIRDFIARTYVPENMYLVIYTSMAEKENSKKKLIDIFEQIPKRPLPKTQEIPSLFVPKNEKKNQNWGKGTFTKLKDSSKIQELTLSFNTNIYNSFSSKSVDFIQNMLQSGDNDQDFCHFVGKLNYWATDCQFFNLPQNRFETMQGVVLTLTKKGANFISQITERFFATIETLRAVGVTEQYYNIFKQQEQFAFEIQEQEDVFDNLTDLGLQFSWNPDESFLYASYDYQYYNRTEIMQILNEFTLENAIFVLRSSDFQGQFKASAEMNDFLFNQQEFEQTKLWNFFYKVIGFNENQVTILENQLPVNITFSDLVQGSKINMKAKMIDQSSSKVQKYGKKKDIKSDFNQTEPMLLQSDKQGNLWFFEDTSFQLAFVAQIIVFDHQNGCLDLKNQLYVQIAAFALNKAFSMPIFSASQRGLQFIEFLPSNLDGEYSEILLFNYRNWKFEQNTDFNYYLECIENQFISQLEDYTLSEGIEFMKKTITKNQVFTVQEFLNELNGFDFSDFQDWFKNYQQNTHIDELIIGNIDQKSALKSYKNNINMLNFKAIKRLNSSSGDIFQLQNSNYVVRFSTEYDHFNQCVVNLYRLPMEVNSDEYSLIINFFNLYFGGYSFQFLRSIHQLGYIAEAQLLQMNGVYHLAILVEGYRKDVQDMDQRIEQLFQYVYDKLEQNMDDKQNRKINLKSFTQTYQVKKSNKGQNMPKFYALSQEVNSFWTNIISEAYFSSSSEKKKEKTIQYLSKQELLNYYIEWFQKEQNKISIQLVNPYVYNNLDTNSSATTNYNGIKQNQIFNTPLQIQSKNDFDTIKSKIKPLVDTKN